MTTGKRTKKSESTKDAAAPEKEGKAPAAKAAAAKEAKPKKAAAPKKDAKKPADGKDLVTQLDCGISNSSPWFPVFMAAKTNRLGSVYSQGSTRPYFLKC